MSQDGAVAVNHINRIQTVEPDGDPPRFMGYGEPRRASISVYKGPSNGSTLGKFGGFLCVNRRYRTDTNGCACRIKLGGPEFRDIGHLAVNKGRENGRVS